MENRYTLTIYVAAPSTPTLKDGEKDTSTVGHVYYSISDGNSKMGWGFAPTISSPIWKGKVVDNEFNIYQNPVLERTMEITKQQYDALKDFGLHPDKHGFNSSVYNAFSNSCVDFLYAALKEGNIYHKQVYGNDITGLVDHEGAIRVPRNIEELKNIPSPIPHSPLNKIIERPLPEQNWSQKNILSKTDNILNIEDMPQYAQNIYHQGKECFVDFCRHENIHYRLAEDNMAMIERFNNYVKEEVRKSPDKFERSINLADNFIADNQQQYSNPHEQQERPQYAHLYQQMDSAKSYPNIEDMPQYAQNIYHQGKECFVDFCRHENIHYREEDLDRIGMSMAAAGYAQGLRGVSLIDVDERTREISIAHESPDLNEAVVNMDKAAATPTAESLNQIQQTAQQFEYETQQRQLAQSQSRGMMIS